MNKMTLHASHCMSQRALYLKGNHTSPVMMSSEASKNAPLDPIQEPQQTLDVILFSGQLLSVLTPV